MNIKSLPLESAGMPRRLELMGKKLKSIYSKLLKVLETFHNFFSIFHDFREEIYKDYNIHKNKIEEIKRYIEELLILINTKVSEKEPKNMECNFLIKKP